MSLCAHIRSLAAAVVPMVRCGPVAAWGVALAGIVSSGPTLARSIVTNGGFETGQIEPWDPEMSFDPEGAEIVTPGRLDSFALHLEAGEYDDYYHITQGLSPISTDLITEISLWSYSGTPRRGQSPSIVLTYSDGTFSQQFFPLTPEWSFTDATAALEPGKILFQVELSWAGLGDEGPSSELIVDDVVIDAVPSPGTGGVFILAMMTAARRRRGNCPR